MSKKLFIIFKVVVILNLLICLVNKEWTATFICLFNFILFFIEDYVQIKLGYNNFFKLLIYMFLIASLVGGEVYYLYVRIKYFDIIMHTLSSFITSGLFVYVAMFFKVNINKWLYIICIFSFAIMVASLWEIVEFSIDRLFDSDMQKDTIIYEINSVKLSNDSKTIVSKRIESTKFDSFIINS